MRWRWLAWLFVAASVSPSWAQTVITDPAQQILGWDFVAQPDAGVITPADMSAITGRVYINAEPAITATGISCDATVCKMPWPSALATRLRAPGVFWSVQLALVNTQGESLKSLPPLILTTAVLPGVTCPYVTPAGVLTPLQLGEFREGINAFPSITRNDQLLSMGMELVLRKDSATTVRMRATCVGIPVGGV
jgi:hypothetical protein